MAYKYSLLVVGGTFDKLHEGHKALLRFAFSLSKLVFITITSDAYTKINKPYVADFKARAKNVEEFLKEENLFERAKIIPIDDIYGITSEKEIKLDAILVTKDTKKGAEKVNEKRKTLGLSLLSIEIMPMVSSETGIPISSSHIRNGILDEKGNLKIKNEITTNRSYLPKKLREELHKPFGEIISLDNLKKITDKKIITVGDVTTKILHEVGFSPKLCVIDFIVERKKQNTSLRDLGFGGEEKIYYITNPASTLTPELWQSIKDAFEDIKTKEKVVIIIDGEEDLVVLPILLLAPEGYTIFYGQPHIGMVAVKVNKLTKKEALELVSKFSITTRGH